VAETLEEIPLAEWPSDTSRPPSPVDRRWARARDGYRGCRVAALPV